MTDEERQEIIDLYNTGQSKKYVAKLMCRSRRTVREILEEEGIE